MTRVLLDHDGDCSDFASINKRVAVVEFESECPITDRPESHQWAVSKGGLLDECFYLCDEIHDWFVGMWGTDYHEKVRMVFQPNDLTHFPHSWMLEFAEPSWATLFKLRWGGEHQIPRRES